VIDLYGRFAAEKLARLMEIYPERVYSKPEFTALPPYLFSGADFALIPSRDEPFGLVAVEFGRKGALGVGSRLGGLGLMPGWVGIGTFLIASRSYIIAVVPSRIKFYYTHALPTYENHQTRPRLHQGGAGYPPSSLCGPAFPSSRVAPENGKLS